MHGVYILRVYFSNCFIVVFCVMNMENLDLCGLSSHLYAVIVDRQNYIDIMPKYNLFM